MRKYQLLRYLNKEHAVPVRLLFAISGYLGTLALTFDLVLSRHSFVDFWDDNFKIAIRRANWILYRRTNLYVLNENIYNFTEGLDIQSLERLDKWFQRFLRKNPEDPKLLSDQLYLWAAIIENDNKRYASIRSKFEKFAEKIISDATSRQFGEPDLKAKDLRKADFSIEHARSALSDFANTFDLDIWNWYVVSGTFLGLVRECGFLPHDYDIDIGVNAENFNLSAFLELLNASDHFALKRIDFQQTYSFSGDKLESLGKSLALVKLVHKTHINLDVFVHHLEGNTRWHGSAFHRWDNKEFQLQRYNLEGTDVLGPVDADQYLTENYGEWKIPVVNFSFATGTPNLSLIKNLSSIALFLKRLSVAREQVEVEKNLYLLSNAGYLRGDRFKFV